MPGKLTFEIKGAKEMENLLKALGPRVASKAGDKALRAAAKPIVDQAKRLVPVDTGALRRSITAQIGRRTKASERVILIGFRPPTSARAHFTEFGTSHSAAHPFMRPAMDTRMHQALREMGRVLGAEIESSAMQMAKKV